MIKKQKLIAISFKHPHQAKAKSLVNMLMVWCFFSQAISAQNIPSNFFGINHWMPDKFLMFNGTTPPIYPHGAVDFAPLQTLVQEIGVSFYRIGGDQYDKFGIENGFDATSNDYIAAIAKIKMFNPGAKFLIQIPFGSVHISPFTPFTPANAATLVENIAAANTGDQFYYTIGNEWDNYYEDCGMANCPKRYDWKQIATFIRAYSFAMKNADPTIKIVAPALTRFDGTDKDGVEIIPEIFSNLGDQWDVSDIIDEAGTNDADGKYYVDILDFHSYKGGNGGVMNGMSASDYSNYRPNAIKYPSDELVTTLNNLQARLAIVNMDRLDSPLTWAITEMNIVYSNPSLTDETSTSPIENTPYGLGCRSFFAGQYWADLISAFLQNGTAPAKNNLEFVCPWSIHEGGADHGMDWNNEIQGNGSINDMGMTKGPASATQAPTPVSTYWHYQMMATNFKGDFLPNKLAVPFVLTSFKAFGYRNSTTFPGGATIGEIGVMILNQDLTASTPFTIYFDGLTTPPTGTGFDIWIDGETTHSPYSCNIKPQTSILLKFDLLGNFISRTEYDIQDAVNNAGPKTFDSDEADLYVKDSYEDIGTQPNYETMASTSQFWESPDVWIRNANDGIQYSETVEYTPSQDNYISVRVKNKGCTTQSGTLKVYWASASTGLDWDVDWINNTTIPSPFTGCTASFYGNEVTTAGTGMAISVDGGDEEIYTIPWQSVNPDDYSCLGTDHKHFCLLARLETGAAPNYGNPSTESFNNGIWGNTADNNNIAWKNIIIDNTRSTGVFGGVIIKNIDENAKYINLNFVSVKDHEGQTLKDFNRIRLYFSKDFLKRWAEGGKRGKGVIMINDSVIELTSSNAVMEHIFLTYREAGAVSLGLKTIKDQTPSADPDFKFQIIQYSENGAINTPQGGQSYLIKKGKRGNNCLTSNKTLVGNVIGIKTFSGDTLLVTGNVTVLPGAKLTFNNIIVLMSQNVTIRVMPGGQFNINKSELIPACIGNKWTVIQVKGNPILTNQFSIINSFITGSNSPLDIDRSKGILISGSTFLGESIGTAIVMDRMKDFQISENTFSNYEVGIKTTNTSAADFKSGIEKNIFLDVKTALYFVNDNHIKLDIKCNRFSYADYAINSNQTTLKDQGSSAEGAGNEFVTSSTLVNNKLKQIGGNNPKYYYDPSNPVISGMNIAILASTSDRTCYTYSFDTSATFASRMATPVEESLSRKIMDVYSVPNPNTGQASIYFSLGEEKQGELMIMDIYGKVIDHLNVTSESNKIDVDYSEYANGIYMISLRNSKGDVMNKKMIIAK